LPASPRGLVLARERGWVLTWDANHWIYLLNRSGGRQAQWHSPAPLVTACCAEDGSAYAAVGGGGEVWWLAPDLMPRWQRALPQPATAAALDPFGQYLAVADSRGQLHLFNQRGKTVFRVASPRPLHYLAFVPAAPYLVGSADYGLVACFDPAGKLLWRDGLVAHVGSLAVTGDGSLIVLACFSEGLQRYSVQGQNQGRWAVPEPCRLATLTFDGQRVLAAGLGRHLHWLDSQGRALGTYPLDQPAAAFALGPLGDYAVVALADGPILGLDVRAV
jgi:sugar lactone lactonase YvrE